MQLIFQDPISSLNPRRRVADIVAEPLRIWKQRQRRGAAGARSTRCSADVGLDPEVAGPKRPHQFSGGQCQRISIARALVLDPTLLICDEPVSALDVSVQAQILNLLEDMKARYGLTLVFIAHDLAVVKNVSDRVAVMYLGKLCEVGGPDELYARPAHPYTAALLSAIPVPDPDVEARNRLELRATRPRRSTRRRAAGSGHGAPVPTRALRSRGTDPATGATRSAAAADHYVACHHPLIEAEAEVEAPAA